MLKNVKGYPFLMFEQSDLLLCPNPGHIYLYEHVCVNCLLSYYYIVSPPSPDFWSCYIFTCKSHLLWSYFSCVAGTNKKGILQSSSTFYSTSSLIRIKPLFLGEGLFSQTLVAILSASQHKFQLQGSGESS